jgi:hypothetical protein
MGRTKRAMANLTQTVLGLVCGACLGNAYAYWTAGQDQLVLHLRRLEECILIDTYCGAIIGTLLGYGVALLFAMLRRGTTARSHTVFVECLTWFCLSVACLFIWATSPFPAAME